VALLSQQPALPVVSPGNYQELTHWLDTLLKDQRGPAVIRYARGSEPAALADKACTGKPFDHLLAAPGAKAAIVSYGTETACALAAAEMLAGQGRPTDVFQMVVINPLPEGLPAALLGYDAILFAEEGIAKGGIGEHLAAALMDIGYKGDYKQVAVRDIHIDHATLPELRAQAGLDAQSLAATLASMLPAPRARAAGDAS